MKILLLLLTFHAILAAPLGASPAPPFGSSLTWNTGKETPSLEAMRGKAVLIVFFQSWCPICNQWAGDMFSKITAEFQDHPEIVLIALKTDGGSVREALDYLEGKLDPDRWLVGTDTNATYARQATGVDRLYRYVWITPDGEIGETAKAGSFVTGSNPKQYWATRKAAKEEFVAPARPLLDPAKALPDALAPAVRLAEQGLYASALRELMPLAGQADLTEAATTLRNAIAEAVRASVDRHGAAVASTDDANRYFSYLALLEIESRFPNSPFAAAARQASSLHASSEWVKREEEAQRSYESLMRRASRADDNRAVERVTQSLREFGSAHSDTAFGRIAAAATDAED